MGDKLLQRGSRCSHSRGTGNVRETGYFSGTQGTGSQRLHFPAFPCSQKRGREETNNQFKWSKYICGEGAFQNGELPYDKGHPKTRRLDDKGRPEGCLLHDSTATSQKQLVQFQWQGETYQFNSLPFGLTSAPRVFTKILKVAMTILRSLGLRMITYIDNILIMAETENLANEHTAALIFLLENLGFIINHPKSGLKPLREIGFLGLIVNSIKMEVKMPGEKIKHIRQDARKILEKESCQAIELSRLLGKLNDARQVIPPAPLFCRNLQHCLSIALNGGRDYSVPAHLTRPAREELARTSHQMEWAQSPLKEARHDYRDRCLNHRLGSIMSGNKDRGTLVPRGKTKAYKLLGVAWQ